MSRALRKTSANTYDVLIDDQVVGHIEFDGGYYMAYRRGAGNRRVYVGEQHYWPRDAAVAIAEAVEADA